MIRFSFAALLIAFCVVPISAQQFPIPSRDVTTPIPCRQRSFSIPFEVRPDGSADPAKEIELMVSKDRGESWHRAGRQSAEAGKFEYTAEDDGELWFSFRTITLSGMTRQSGGGGPRVRVLVDSTAPVLALEMTQQASGEMLVSWKVEEKNHQGKLPDFAAASSSTEKEWTPLNIDGKHFQRTETGMEGRFLFWPENDIVELELRAVVTDVAANRTEKICSAKIKPVHRDEETRIRDALKAGEEKPMAPDGRIETLPQSRSVPDSSVERSNASAMRLQPPKPVRMRKTPKDPASSAEPTSLTEKSGSETPKPLPELPRVEKDEMQRNAATPSPKTPTESNAGDPLTEELIVNMNRFFGGTLESGSVEKKVAEQKTGPMLREQEPRLKQKSTVPETNHRVVPVSAAAPVVKPEEPGNVATAVPEAATDQPNPGRITGISMNTASDRPQIIVKWHIGDAPWRDAQVDVMRSTDIRGPWFPVTTNLPNNGEYWWYLSADDLKPFYVMIHLRSLRGGFHVDATKSPIRINPKSVGR